MRTQVGTQSDLYSSEPKSARLSFKMSSIPNARNRFHKINWVVGIRLKVGIFNLRLPMPFQYQHRSVTLVAKPRDQSLLIFMRNRMSNDQQIECAGGASIHRFHET